MKAAPEFKRAKDLLSEFFDRPVFAKKSLGQNFLVNDSVIAKIIAAATALQAQSAIEIGPGPGALTQQLRHHFDQLLLIELDKDFAEHWRSEGLKVIEEDALQFDWQIPSPEKTVLVSNLPYQIASSLIIERSLDKQPLCGLILMMQKEVAERLMARPHTSEYGLTTVITQSFWQLKKVVDAGSHDFKPAPKVQSRVLQFSQGPAASWPVQDKRKFLTFVKTCFQQKRKILRTNLKSLCAEPVINQLFADKDLPLTPTTRAEELSVAQFHDLFAKWRALQ